MNNLNKSVVKEDDYFQLTYKTTIGGSEVMLVGESLDDGSMEVSFTVDGTFTKHNSKHRVAITRWLLKCWKDMSLQHHSFFCEPKGGTDSWRGSIYKKLGFKRVDNEIMTKGRFR